jgi:hypothetical protein
VRKAEHRTLLRQPFDPELVARVGPDDGQLPSRAANSAVPPAWSMWACVSQIWLQRQPQALAISASKQVQVATRVDDGSLASWRRHHTREQFCCKGGDGNGEVASAWGRKAGLQDAG